MANEAKNFPAGTYVYCGRYEMRHKSEAEIKKSEAKATDERYPHLIGDFSGAPIKDVLVHGTVGQGLTVAFRPEFRDKATPAQAKAWRTAHTLEMFKKYAGCVPADIRAKIEAGEPWIVLSFTTKGTMDVPLQLADMREILKPVLAAAGMDVATLADKVVEQMFAAFSTKK